MKTKKLITSLVLSLITSYSFAQNLPQAITLTAADAYYNFNTKRNLDDSAMPNLSLAYNATEKFAVEFTTGVLNSKQKPNLGDKSVHGALYTLNGIYRFYQAGHFEPYIKGGAGILTLVPNGIDIENPGVVNLGLGAQLFWGPNVALRAEATDVYQATGASRNDFYINLGVSFLFGGKCSPKDLKLQK